MAQVGSSVKGTRRSHEHIIAIPFVPPETVARIAELTEVRHGTVEFCDF